MLRLGIITFPSFLCTYLHQHGMKETAECFWRESNSLATLGQPDPNFWGNAKENVDKLWSLYLSEDKHDELKELTEISTEVCKTMMRNLFRGKNRNDQFNNAVPSAGVIRIHDKNATPAEGGINTMNADPSKGGIHDGRDKVRILQRKKWRSYSEILVDTKKWEEKWAQKWIEKEGSSQMILFNKKENLPNDVLLQILSKTPIIRFYNAVYRYMVKNNFLESLRMLRRQVGMPYIRREAFDVDKDDVIEFFKYYIEHEFCLIFLRDNGYLEGKGAVLSTREYRLPGAK